eukprot:scaffold24586_cov111-Isochrysis_galbana.AAC.10
MADERTASSRCRCASTRARHAVRAAVARPAAAWAAAAAAALRCASRLAMASSARATSSAPFKSAAKASSLASPCALTAAASARAASASASTPRSSRVLLASCSVVLDSSISDSAKEAPHHHAATPDRSRRSSRNSSAWTQIDAARDARDSLVPPLPSPAVLGTASVPAGGGGAACVRMYCTAGGGASALMRPPPVMSPSRPSSVPKLTRQPGPAAGSASRDCITPGELIAARFIAGLAVR